MQRFVAFQPADEQIDAAPDRFEREDEAFFARVREGYAQRLAQSPQRFVRLDASGPREAVWTQIVDALQQRPWW